MTGNRLFWLLVVLTLGVYMTMLVWSIPAISAAAGGLPIFDMRPGGYSFAEARAFLAALTPEGAAFYTNVQHRLDMAYPVLLALTLFWSIIRLAPGRWGSVRWLLAATALPGMVFDYRENAAVAGLLEAGAGGITPEMVASASLQSQLKAGLTTLAMVILLILLAMWVFRRWRNRRRLA